MSEQIFTTKTDALDYAILPALGEYADEHDLDVIFDRAFTYNGRGYVQSVDTDEFWTIVADAAR